MNIIAHPQENASRIKTAWKRGLRPFGKTPIPCRLIYYDTHFPETDLTMSGRMCDGRGSQLLCLMQRQPAYTSNIRSP